jgi:membrane-bound lytic murein transglycosylase D
MHSFLLSLCLSMGPAVPEGPADLAEPAVAGAAAEPAPAPAAEPDDDPAVAREVEEQSAELEELRALEQAVLGSPSHAGELRGAVRRLGLGNPMRHRLLEALDGLDEAEGDADAPPPELEPITDLSTFDVATVKDRYDIPVEMQPLVAQYIRFFQGPGRGWFRKWMSRSTRFIPVMVPILEAAGVPRDTVYLAMIESGFSAQAYSWAHAAGPWQFINGTGKMFGLKNDFWVDERRDPIKSTRAAARYLKQLHAEMGDWYLAWASYNAGGGRIRRMIDRKGSRDFWVLSDGKGLAAETKHYVPKLIAAALVAKHPRAFGFTDEDFDYLPLFEYDEVEVPAPTDLEILARAAGVTAHEITDLNPELKRWCTPPLPGGAAYKLRVPKGQGAIFRENYPKIAPAERLTFKVHRIRRGDTLSRIAALHRSAPEAIMQINRLRNPRSLRVDTELIIPVPGGRAAKAGQPDAALERQVARARRSGFQPVRPEEEVPAGTSTRSVATGPIKTDVVNGRTRITYGVQPGDTLWAIGQRFDCSVEDLRRWNKLGRRSRRLQVGTVLSVWPGDRAAPVQNVAGTLVAPKVR